MSCLSLSLFLALLLRLQLVIKFLLEFLFREVHFTNGSVVLYSPLSSCTVGQSLVLNKSLKKVCFLSYRRRRPGLVDINGVTKKTQKSLILSGQIV